MEIVVDSSVVVALVMESDAWHFPAGALMKVIAAAGHRTLYFDCVAAEAVSVITRRLYEKRLAVQVPALLARMEQLIPYGDITWILPEVPRLYPDAPGLVRTSGGALNFNDALLALVCRERGIPAIASFDADFDQVPWLRRLAQPADVAL